MAKTCAKQVVATLASLGISGVVVRAAEGQVIVQVRAEDVLIDQGNGVASLCPGIPAFVGAVPIRYQLGDGSTLGVHGPRGVHPR